MVKDRIKFSPPWIDLNIVSKQMQRILVNFEIFMYVWKSQPKIDDAICLWCYVAHRIIGKGYYLLVFGYFFLFLFISGHFLPHCCLIVWFKTVRELVWLSSNVPVSPFVYLSDPRPYSRIFKLILVYYFSILPFFKAWSYWQKPSESMMKL